MLFVSCDRRGGRGEEKSRWVGEGGSRSCRGGREGGGVSTGGRGWVQVKAQLLSFFASHAQQAHTQLLECLG